MCVHSQSSLLTHHSAEPDLVMAEAVSDENRLMILDWSSHTSGFSLTTNRNTEMLQYRLYLMCPVEFSAGKLPSDYCATRK